MVVGPPPTLGSQGASEAELKLGRGQTGLEQTPGTSSAHSSPTHLAQGPSLEPGKVFEASSRQGPLCSLQPQLPRPHPSPWELKALWFPPPGLSRVTFGKSFPTLSLSVPTWPGCQPTIWR